MLIVGYYTPGVYERFADNLRRNLDDLKIEHDLVPIADRGSWMANTSFKSRFVRLMMRKHKRPIVQLDVDARVMRYPELLDSLDCDVAAAKYGRELLSGTVYFSATSPCRAMVNKWITLCDEYPDRIPSGMLSYHLRGAEAWDQRLLWIAIDKTPLVKFVELPHSYCYIHDLSRKKYPSVEPVILHFTASIDHPDKVAARA